uniref:Putative secreted protein n=2 Tax=Anopheles marajoara TaxID=58244 RepID=A0A2M4C2D3_9DIPT
MMRPGGMRLLVTVLVSLIAVQNVAAFTDTLDDIWSLFFDSSSSESDSMETINVRTKNATIQVDCAVPCTLNVVCNNCNTMASNMQPNGPAPPAVANGAGGTVPSSASVTTPTSATASAPADAPTSTSTATSPTTSDITTATTVSPDGASN